MALWPPSPIVEDEATALAKEHSTENMISNSVQAADSVPSRGEVDQCPVIVDSDTNNDAPIKTSPKSAPSKRRDQSCPPSLLFAENGLPTPPSSDTETRGRSGGNEFRRDEEARLTRSSPRSKSTTRLEPRHHSRPSMPRLQTDISGNVQEPKTDNRRAPSPYSYSRETGTVRVFDELNPPTGSHLSPDHDNPSPRTPRQSLHGQERSLSHQEGDSSTDTERKPRKSLRFATEHLGPTSGPCTPERTNYAADSARFDSAKNSATDVVDSKESNPEDARRLGRQKSRERDSDVQQRSRRSKSRSTKASHDVRGSPYSSSAEESVRSRREQSTKQFNSDEQSVQRAPSHRRERPRLEGLTERITSHGKSSPSDDEVTRRVYRVKDGRSPLTPPTLSTPNHMEDYFSRAFKENSRKTGQYTPRSSLEETVTVLPPTSPPRTPKSEWTDRQDYFASPSSSPHRTPIHSRGPSFDETAFKDSKMHSSLLSQAISAAAVQASRGSHSASRSLSNAIETTFACTGNALQPKQRSRASSPEHDRLHRAEPVSYIESNKPQVTYPSVPQPSRPTTRDGLPRLEVPSTSRTQPQRNASWTGSEPRYHAAVTAAAGSPLSQTTNPEFVKHIFTSSPPHRSPSTTSTDRADPQLPTIFVQCKRSKPTQGFRDWVTLDGLSDIDICPSCAQSLGHTRYRSLLIRSKEKPYDRYTICALSKPWICAAFAEGSKLKKPSLSLVEKVHMLPTNIRPCTGLAPNVRTWWKLIDPVTERAVPDFSACNACVRSVHVIYRDLPDQFVQQDLEQESTCSFHADGKDLANMLILLEQAAEKSYTRGSSKPRYIQPFVDFVRRVTRYPPCAKDALLENKTWHFMNTLPEFTICDSCYHEVVWPMCNKSIAREISKVGNVVPVRGSQSDISNPKGSMAPPISCQLYSDRMRRIFSDAVNGQLSYDVFRSKVRERQAAQYRLNDMNRLYMEDQAAGWDRRADIERNKQLWKSLE